MAQLEIYYPFVRHLRVSDPRSGDRAPGRIRSENSSITCTFRSDSAVDCSADDCFRPLLQRKDLVGSFRKNSLTFAF
jgi:hypothetical protein